MEPKTENMLYKVWRLTRDYTASMLKSAFEKVIKKPLGLLFNRRSKSRGKGDEKQAIWWIEVKAGEDGEEDLKMLCVKLGEIEQWVGCHIEVKSY